MTALIDDLLPIVGDVGLVVGADAAPYTTDWADKLSDRAVLAVVRPGSTDEVAAVVELCHRRNIAIVPQGGNTGLCGGSVPVASDDSASRPSIILVLSRLNSILSIDVDRATVTTQAGVTIQELQEACAAQGMLFAPDWGARGTAQIGGGVSTNAGGLNVLRWGSLRSQVLGLEVVLPDGRVWDGLRALRKDATGLDLKQLFIGTEGTLGIVTAVVCTLHPLPEHDRTALIALPELEALLPLFARVRDEAGDLLSAFELLPEEGLVRVCERVPHARHPFTDRRDWYVLLRFSGDAAVESALADVLANATEAGLVDDAVIAATQEQEENLWVLRDEVPPPFTFDANGNRHKFDMAIPVDRVVEFIHRVGPIVDSISPGTRTFAFGHIGDGNLHFSIYPGTDADVSTFLARGDQLERAIDELTWEFGGTISAEHGVGQIMRGRVVRQKSDVELDLMRAVKSALDPEGIMNPGKILPTIGPPPCD